MNSKYALEAITNCLQVNLDDVTQVDIDGNYIGFRASKSYWIDTGWIDHRWTNYGLPQIAVFRVGGSSFGEGVKSNSERYESQRFLIDVFASGADQRDKLNYQIKDALYTNANRTSMLASGIKFDRVIQDNNSIDDEILPQKIYRNQLVIQTYFINSGVR